MIVKRGVAVLLGLTFAPCGRARLKPPAPGTALTPQERHEAIRRAGVWSPTDIPSIDFKAGPDAKGGFASNEWVTCEYKKKELTGKSPKFDCETDPGHEAR